MLLYLTWDSRGPFGRGRLYHRAIKLKARDAIFVVLPLAGLLTILVCSTPVARRLEGGLYSLLFIVTLPVMSILLIWLARPFVRQPAWTLGVTSGRDHS